MGRMRSTICGVAAVLAALLAPSASAAGLPTLLTQIGRGNHFLVRPAQIVYTGDGSGILGGFNRGGPYPRFGSLRWSLWNRQQAVGSGAVWLDNCSQDCAQGTIHPYAVRVHAFDPKAGHFTRLTLSFNYEGEEVIDRRGVSKYGSDYGYYIISTSRGSESLASLSGVLIKTDL